MKYKNLLPLGAALLATVIAHSSAVANEVEIPFELAKGQILFEKYCSGCHGLQLDGTDQGPPLIHPYYKPSHHSDRAFVQAIQAGSQQHHWKFGDMPAIHELLPGEIRQVVDFVRWMQQQKGLN